MILAAANYTWYAARAGGMLAFVLLDRLGRRRAAAFGA